MGQQTSSGNGKVHKRKDRRSLIANKEVHLLPQEEELLGRCWLLASSSDSFSPSRWFALMPSTLEGARPAQRRAFSIAHDVLPPGERLRQPVLRDLGINVHKGLSICGFQNITVSSISASAAQQMKSLRVGGVQVPLPPFPSVNNGIGNASCLEQSIYVVVAVRRVSLEAELREYATAGYTRYPVQAPPANDDERREYGEGCITGLLYGAAVVLHVPASLDAAARLAQLCRVAARESNIPPETLQIQEENVKGAKATANLISELQTAAPAPSATTEATVSSCSSPSPFVHLLSVDCGIGFDAKLKCFLRVSSSDKSKETVDAENALKAVAEWVVQVHQTPSAWCPLNAFLQRYEAIVSSLLVGTRKKG